MLAKHALKLKVSKSSKTVIHIELRAVQ